MSVFELVIFGGVFLLLSIWGGYSFIKTWSGNPYTRKSKKELREEARAKSNEKYKK